MRIQVGRILESSPPACKEPRHGHAATFSWAIERVDSVKLDLPAHHESFLSSIAGRERPNADIEINHMTTSLCHLANIATRTGRPICFDSAGEKILGDDEAAKLLRRSYREGHWAVPKGVRSLNVHQTEAGDRHAVVGNV
jgi:hypothetical protein